MLKSLCVEVYYIFVLQEKSTDIQRFLQVKVNKIIAYSSTVRKSLLVQGDFEECRAGPVTAAVHSQHTESRIGRFW